MLEDVIIIGIVMGLTEIVKQGLKVSTQYIPLVVLVLAGLLNVANAAVFDASAFWQPALLEGLTFGAVAGGIYSLGKAALGRS